MLRLCLKEKPPHLREQLVKGMPPAQARGVTFRTSPTGTQGKVDAFASKPFETLRLKR